MTPARRLRTSNSGPVHPTGIIDPICTFLPRHIHLVDAFLIHVPSSTLLPPLLLASPPHPPNSSPHPASVLPPPADSDAKTVVVCFDSNGVGSACFPTGAPWLSTTESGYVISGAGGDIVEQGKWPRPAVSVRKRAAGRPGWTGDCLVLPTQAWRTTSALHARGTFFMPKRQSESFPRVADLPVTSHYRSGLASESPCCMWRRTSPPSRCS